MPETLKGCLIFLAGVVLGLALIGGGLLIILYPGMALIDKGGFHFYTGWAVCLFGGFVGLAGVGLVMGGPNSLIGSDRAGSRDRASGWEDDDGFDLD